MVSRLALPGGRCSTRLPQSRLWRTTDQKSAAPHFAPRGGVASRTSWEQCRQRGAQQASMLKLWNNNSSWGAMVGRLLLPGGRCSTRLPPSRFMEDCSLEKLDPTDIGS